MFQSNPSCGRARNNYTRKMSFSSPFSPSVFNSVFISPPPWRSTLFSFLSYFLPLLFALLSCFFSLLCLRIVPSSSFVVLCHSFPQCIVSLQLPLLAAFKSPPLHPRCKMLQSSFGDLLVKQAEGNGSREEMMLLLF